MFIFKKNILKDKVALITGGSSGIGLGIAHSFAEAGANVVIASRRSEKCKSVADELKQKYNIMSIGLGMDVRNSKEVNQVFKIAVEKMGKLDILINNAAGNFYFPASKMRDKLWNAVIDIDLNGTFYCSRTAFKYMKEKGGVILNTSMTLHYNGWAGMAHASSAKAGIDSLTKTLALEWGHLGIRVNAVAPGPILTEGVKKAFSRGGPLKKENIPLRRMGEPEEIGQLMVYLASDAASWVTGSIIVIDGGESLSTKRAGMDPVELAKMNTLKPKEE